MNIKVKGTWYKSLSCKDTGRYWSDDQWYDLDIVTLSSTDFEKIEKLVEADTSSFQRSNSRKIAAYNMLRRDVDGMAIRNLDTLCLALKLLLVNYRYKWLFEENDDGNMIPWYVVNIEYFPYDKRREAEAHTVMTLAATYRTTKNTRKVFFRMRDLKVKKTAYEVLSSAGYYVETEEMLEDYELENKLYQACSGKTGTQYLASGHALRRGEAVSMERDGLQARVVMDDLASDSEEESSSRSSNCEQTVTGDFWMTPEALADLAASGQNIPTVVLPVQPYVNVFDLNRHTFVDIHVRNLQDYVYDETLIDKLVLSDERKDLITMLVSGTGLVMEDIIKGKTGGIIAICTGPAGTGKTLTAECFSEQVKRPLYCVQCSQLGVSASTLETTLLKVLRRATRWQAILLIDEADVYIHERGSDINQNAIVGVFLRVLERYQGILFMTSNRSTIIDDAIMSRATAWIQYDYPTVEQTASIWKVLSKQYEVTLDDEQIAKLTREFPKVSGRSIKNMLKLARLLSASRKKPVGVEMLVYVSKFLDISVDRKADLPERS